MTTKTARRTRKSNPAPAAPTEEQLAAVRTMPAPALVIWRTENLWTHTANGNHTHGFHVYEIEMRLECETLTGPQYRSTGRVVSESGRPPSNAREASTCAGVSWRALPEYINSGKIKAVS